MTYDYPSHNGVVGGNAPLDWIEQNALYFIRNEPEHIRQKLLIGLNFYGTKYVLERSGKLKAQPESITGAQFVEMLRKHKSVVKAHFDEESEENFCVFDFKEERWRVFYPSLYSIKKRIELAESLGTGLSIWELGQGLDYFYDLFWYLSHVLFLYLELLYYFIINFV